MSETFINLGPYAFVRVELLALSPTGPFRLTTEHPARRLVEYFDDAAAALVRREEIETTLVGGKSELRRKNYEGLSPSEFVAF